MTAKEAIASARIMSERKTINKPPRCAYSLLTEQPIKHTIKGAHNAKEGQNSRSFSFTVNLTDTKTRKYLVAKYFLTKFAAK